ncbi:MAG: aldo/keto reductase [Anaerolineae bacterium]|jgi:voltage-dependent potassium channel beta subunit|nr:aldo/keto reductase [Anaerolineae bacterium]MBT4310904.1 aldo/keto reductase [Anaerolineae bacterium]MBT4457776.1 aldo/keto reductase [Anaerolineae bacterium]MBT4843392.1 aldo/keto reductase [Anaerolineae bacterium]MBT6061935.1 aldo/keto reductase [Anaerolineae bacterium]
MEYRRLGSSGLKVSALSFGAWVTFGDQIGEDVAQEMMQAAIDAGVNFFDNAEVYAGGKAETVMGNVVKKAGWKRSDLVFSTKIFWGGDGPNNSGLSRKHIIEGVDAALERLQMDYIDLVFAHRADMHTPVEETVRAFNHVIDQGKAFYWGTSEWSAVQIMEAHAVARDLGLIPPTMEQPQYHMFHRERVEAEYARLYQEAGMGTTIWSPLASGLLTGKYNAGMPEGTRANLAGYEWLKKRFTDETAIENITKVGKLLPIAEEIGCTMAQLALAWTLKNPNVSTTMTGASRVEQVVENMKAIEYVEKLTPDVMEAIETILDNKPAQETDWR